jgi:hypothetical protein
MATTPRNYNHRDVDMLVTTSTIIENAIANKTLLQSKRTTWADPFFDDLKTRIDSAMHNFLGLDKAKDLRQATQAIAGIHKQAIKDLAECKVQITEDFKADKTKRDELLNQLGFTAYHKEAQKGDQEALINLLFQFKTSLTATLKTEISTKGTSATLLDTIAGYAVTLKNADINQETFKGNKKTITAVALKEFNEIYDQVISICKIASKFYKDEPHLQAQFSYAKVAKALNITKKTTITPPTTPTV